MKKLIVIKNSESTLLDLVEFLRPHDTKHSASIFRRMKFEGSGLTALIYLDLTALDQLKLLKSIRKKWPKLSIIFSGGALTSDEVISLFRGGLTDYLTEPTSENDLNEAIQRVDRQYNGIAFNPSKYNLTNREFQVCKLLVEGFNGKTAAEFLQITPATIKIHKSRGMRKLGAKNLPDLVRILEY